MAWALGFGIAADLSYDSTAFAQHVTAGLRGMDDRLGRAAALLVFALPLTLLAAAVPPILTGSAETMVVSVGLSLGMLLVGVEVSSVTSARLIYPVPQPVSWLIMAALMIPELVLWWGIRMGARSYDRRLPEIYQQVRSYA